MAKEYQCIEPNCDQKVSGPNRRCYSHAAKVRAQDPAWKQRQSEEMQMRWKDPKFQEQVSRGIQKAWENGNYSHVDWSALKDEVWSEQHSIDMQNAWQEGKYDHVDWNAHRDNGWVANMQRKLEEYWEDGDNRQAQSSRLKVAWERGDYDTEEAKQNRSMAVFKRWEPGGDLFGAEHLHTPEAQKNISQGQKQRYADPEELRKNSESTKAAWREEKYDNESTRRRFSEAIKQNWEEGVYDDRRPPQSPTIPELKISAALDVCGIEHEPQYSPKGCRYIFDEYLPQAQLIIEVDGDYWHGLPEVIERDARKDAWAKDNGYKLLHISENDINEYGAWSIVLREVVPLRGIA